MENSRISSKRNLLCFVFISSLTISVFGAIEFDLSTLPSGTNTSTDPIVLPEGNENDVYQNIQFTYVPGSNEGPQDEISWGYSGTIPAGMTFNNASGLLSGTPTKRCVYNFTVTVTEENYGSDSKNFQIVILTVPDLGSDFSVCAGASVSLDAGTGYDIYLWTGGSTGQVLNITVNSTTTYSVTATNNLVPSGTCEATDEITVSVVTQPAAPAVTRNPDADVVCEGTDVSAIITSGSGGVGCQLVQECSYDNNGSWSNYNPSVDPNLSTSGHSSVSVRARMDNCTSGSGCNPSAYTTVTWDVESAPTAPALNEKTPPFNKVCDGSFVSATIIPGTGGNCEDTYEKSFDESGTWSDYDPESPTGINTSGHSKVEIRARRDACDACPGTGNIPIATWEVMDCPLDIMLVLDVSGSMGGSAGTTPYSTKLEKLKEAIEVLLDPAFVQPYFMNCDRIGAIYFESEVEPDNPQLIELQDEANITLLEQEINATVPLNYTAMGGGLYKAYRTLQNNDNDYTQNIILVTDGMQNYNPMVEEDETTGKLTFKEPSVGYPPYLQKPYGNSNISLSGDPIIIDDEDVKIHTIAINASSDYKELMSELASRTGGTSNINPTDDGLQFHEFLTLSFINAARECSPQLIDYRYSSITTDGQVETFSVDRYSDHLMFIMTGHKDDHASFRFGVHKGNEDLTGYGRISDGTHYRIFSIDLPVQVGDKTMNAQGDWDMVINGTPGVNYQACAIVDNHTLDFDCRLKVKNLRVATPLEIKVDLASEGIPVTDAKVTATVYKPAEKIGKIISRTSVRTLKRERINYYPDELAYIKEKLRYDSVLMDMPTYADMKYRILAGDPVVSRIFSPEKQEVVLRHTGDGTYYALFTNTRKPGVYRVEYRIEGNSEELGHYIRKDSRAVYVSYNESGLCRSRLYVFKGMPELDLPARVYIRPKDRYGNLLGPGYAERIEVSLSEGKAGMVQDNLDGSYLIPLSGIGTGSQPELRVSVMDSAVYDGSYVKLKNRFFAKLFRFLLVPKKSYLLNPTGETQGPDKKE